MESPANPVIKNNNNSISETTKESSVKIVKKPSIYSLIKTSVFRGINAFILSYGIRTTISFVLHIIGILRKRRFGALMSLRQIVDFTARESSVRLGLLVGNYVGLFHMGKTVLPRLLGISEPQATLISGTVGGISLLCQSDKETRRTVALYTFVRALKCFILSLNKQDWFQTVFQPTKFRHYDTLLFILASAQVMYAYVCKPSTLPKSYFNFIVRTGPIHRSVLSAVKNSSYGIPIDKAPLVKFVSKYQPNFTADMIDSVPRMIPCSVLHPQCPSCTKNNVRIGWDVIKKIFPVYSTLTFVPMLVLRFKKVLKDPFGNVSFATISAGRSTLFLALFVCIYQATICSLRNFASSEHRYMYWVAGVLASTSIFVEKSNRRAELAFYVLPRAIESVYNILKEKGIIQSLPFGEVMLFCISMGSLMYYFHHETDVVGPYLQKTMQYIDSFQVFAIPK